MSLNESKQTIENLSAINDATNQNNDQLSIQNEVLLKDLDQLKEAIEISNEFVDYLENNLYCTQVESEELRKELEKKALLRETSEYRYYDTLFCLKSFNIPLSVY